MSRRAVRRGFDRLEARLVPLAVGAPRTALLLADLLGRSRNALSRRWPAPRQLRALFPALGATSARRVASRIASSEGKTRLVVSLLRHGGLTPLRPLVAWRPGALETLPRPAILGTFHLGAWEALGPAIERLPGPIALLRQDRLYAPRPPVTVLETAGGAQRRAAAFHGALDALERGGHAVLAVDVDTGPGLPVRCLGRSLALPRGAFALAWRTGAPIHPLVGRWAGLRVEASTGPGAAVAGRRTPPPSGGIPDDSRPDGAARGAGEQELADDVAAWLEGYLLARPGELGLGLLRELLAEG